MYALTLALLAGLSSAGGQAGGDRWQPGTALARPGNSRGVAGGRATAQGVARALRRTVPNLSGKTSRHYARLMVQMARRHRVGVDWIAARTYVESNFRNVISRRFRGPGYWRQSFGLMQTEVTPRTNPQYLGRERELLRPEVSFHLGAKILGYWLKRHKSGRCTCPGPWWRHYKWGYRVPKRKRPRGGWKMENFRRRFLRAMKD